MNGSGLAADAIAACQKCSSSARLNCLLSGFAGILLLNSCFRNCVTAFTIRTFFCLWVRHNESGLWPSHSCAQKIRKTLIIFGKAGLMVLGLDAMRGFGKAWEFCSVAILSHHQRNHCICKNWFHGPNSLFLPCVCDTDTCEFISNDLNGVIGIICPDGRLIKHGLLQ